MPEGEPPARTFPCVTPSAFCTRMSSHHAYVVFIIITPRFSSPTHQQFHLPTSHEFSFCTCPHHNIFESAHLLVGRGPDYSTSSFITPVDIIIFDPPASVVATTRRVSVSLVRGGAAVAVC